MEIYAGGTTSPRVQISTISVSKRNAIYQMHLAIKETCMTHLNSLFNRGEMEGGNTAPFSRNKPVFFRVLVEPIKMVSIVVFKPKTNIP